MKRNPEINQELKDLGVNIPDVSLPMGVPEGYFNSFESNLLERLEIETVLEKLPKQLPYQLESGYFETFDSELQDAIFADSLPKSMPYEVPVGYFDQLEASINKKIISPKPEMKPMRKVSPVFSFLSIAASILLVLGLAFWMMNQKNTLSVEQQMAKISTHEIQEYMNAHPSEFGSDLSFENIDENQIDIMSLETEVYDNFDLKNMSSEELEKFVF
ncbi:MAG: hypothetical protein JNM95_03040 [Chitinophagaceae bacterium]|nr:hypothetical protein [Chitinophagaceae bacterium]